jgi:hypothetical protein
VGLIVVHVYYGVALHGKSLRVVKKGVLGLGLIMAH